MCDRSIDELPCRQRPCQPSEKKRSEDSGDVNAVLRGRPLLFTGVVWIGIVRRFLNPQSCWSYQRSPNSISKENVEANATRREVSLVQAANSVYEPPLRIQRQQPVPLVTDPEETKQDLESSHLRSPKDVGVSLVLPLKPMVIKVQEASAVAATQAQKQDQLPGARPISREQMAIFQDIKESTAEVVNTIRSKDGRKFRMAMISGCGLIGYLAGRRRGIVTRVVYSATGVTAMATICYPEETMMYNRQGLATMKRCMVLGHSVIRRGPKTPLGGHDMNISNFETSNDNKEMTIPNDEEETDTTLYSTDNIMVKLMDNVWILGPHLQYIKTKLKESSSTTVANQSIRESTTNSVYPRVSASTTTNSLDHQSLTECALSDQLKNLPTENDKTPIKHPSPDSVPLSPAFPFPPKINLSLSQDKISQINKKDTLPENPLELNTTIKCNRSNERLTFHRAAEVSGGVDHDDEDEADIERMDDDFSDIPGKDL